MNQIVCTASTGSVGGTFLDWSINFLSGQHSHYCIPQQSWNTLTANPLNGSNAHGHNKNHPAGSIETKNHVTHAMKVQGLVTIHPTLLRTKQVCEQLNIDITDLNSKTQQQILEFQTQDYKTALEYVNRQNIKIVLLDSDPRLPLYNSFIRSVDYLPFSNKGKTTASEINQHVDQLFFSDSIQYWQAQDLNNIWDKRERLALCTRPFNDQHVQLGLEFEHLRINCQTFWHRGPMVVQQVMNFLGIIIQPERFAQWLSIYTEWHQLQCQTLQFHYDYPHIVNAIVNNWYLEIDLSFEQEVIVQHCLIYQFGLNLKTWNLSKFPNNTQDLHKLLETNIHPLV